MKQNLVPTRIVNKNGVTTTVHKKPAQATTTSAKLPTPSAPAPVSNALTQDQRNELITEIQEGVQDLYMKTQLFDPGMHEGKAVRRLMLNSTDKAINMMHEYVMTPMDYETQPHQGTNEEYKRRAFLGMISEYKTQATPHNVHEYLTFKGSLEQTLNSNPDYAFNHAVALINSLHSYPQLPVMDDYAEADEDTQRKAAALFAISDKLFTEYFKRLNHWEKTTIFPDYSNADWREVTPIPRPTPTELGIPMEIDQPHWDTKQKTIRLLGEDLINLVMKRPENADAIAQHIIDRNNADTDHLREVFDNEAPALRSGII
jgi:hypothetical protein